METLVAYPPNHGDRIHPHSPYTNKVKTFVFKKSSHDGTQKIKETIELTELSNFDYPDYEIDIVSDSQNGSDTSDDNLLSEESEYESEVEELSSDLIPFKSDEDLSKYSYFPVEHPSLEKFYQTQKSMFWVAQDIPYASDRADWERLDKPTKKYIKFIIFFFAQFDGIVIENLIEHFKKDTSFLKDAKNFYSAQEFMEVIHNETYSNLIVTYITDEAKRTKAFNAIKNYPSIGKIADWVLRWMKSDLPLLERVVAFACLEGIFFSSAFASIYWIKRRNILKALCKANEFIARDEALHTEFAFELYKVIVSSGKHQALENSRIKEIISDSVNVIEDFTRNALRVDLIDMNADDMVEYIKCTADTLSQAFGSGKIYKAKNPFDWMAVLGLSNKSNFFETTVSEYGTQGVADFTWDLNIPY